MSENEHINQAFVQTFLAHNVLTFEQAQPLLAAIFSIYERKPVAAADITQEDFSSIISAANDSLSPLDLEIRSAFHQESRERYYALVNTTSDALTQMATIHSTDEIAYVKRLLDAMFETNNIEKREAMCIAGKDALNLVRAGRRETTGEQSQSQSKLNLTSTEAESLLSHLLVEGWLEKSPKGFYSLSTRALMELGGWLVETYNDDDDNAIQKIKSCQACKEIITTGQRCPAQDCPIRLHDICTQSYFRSRKSRNCPRCKTEWDGNHFVGEKAVTTSDSYLRGKRRSGAQSRVNLDEDDDVNDDNDRG